MLTSLLFAGVLITVVILKYVYKPTERCPDCHTPRDGTHPICACGYVFEFPDDDDPLEYSDSDGPTEPR